MSDQKNKQRFIGPTMRLQRVKSAAAEKGISMWRLAKDMGVQYQSLYKSLRNDNITLDTLKKIAKELDVSIGYLTEL